MTHTVTFSREEGFVPCNCEFCKQARILFRKFYPLTRDPYKFATSPEFHEKVWRSVLLRKKFLSTYHEILFRDFRS